MHSLARRAKKTRKIQLELFKLQMNNSIFKDNLFANRVAFVTGGGTGITGGVARALAAHGASVALVSRKMENLAPAAERIESTGGKAVAVVADVRDASQVENALTQTRERFGRIDIVVNGAAGNFLCKAEELSPNGFGTVVDIDLKGTFNVCRAAFDDLKKSGGVILNISATLQYLGTPMQVHASAAKAGVDALTKNLAVEWGRYGVRTNAIAPGPVGDTEGVKRLVPDEIKERVIRRIPLGRMGEIADVTNTAVFLCSDAARYINGAIIVVDGGQWLAASSLFGG